VLNCGRTDDVKIGFLPVVIGIEKDGNQPVFGVREGEKEDKARSTFQLEDQNIVEPISYRPQKSEKETLIQHDWERRLCWFPGGFLRASLRRSAHLAWRSDRCRRR